MSLATNEKESIPVIHRAIDLGINFFDTADIYDKGRNEELLGKAFAGKRDKVILASKAGNVHRADGNGLDWNPSKKHILESIEGSLKRLNTDHIDLYMLHGGTIEDNIDESIEAFELLLKQGKIRYYGISSIRPNVIAEYIRRSSIVSVMMQYSLLDRRPEESCLDLLKQNNIGVLSRGALAQGLLAGKPAKSYLDHPSEDVKKASDAVEAISGPEYQRTSAQTAVRYVLRHPALTSAVVGMRTIEQLEELAGTENTPLITDDEVKMLKNEAKPLLYTAHRT